MKKFFLLFLCTMCCSVCFTSCFNHSTRISINEDDDYYKFSALYNKLQSQEIKNYINEHIAPDNLDGDYIDVTTTLEDATNFYIKETPGRLKIIFNKHKNSEASYQRIKKMCAGIKNILASKTAY
ncbi:MAG TPA: hypothetical protein VG847_16355 [Chitinophagaceae bacterium]|nr:hypothetical protein [Chitinophagaceae bacterium]